MKFLILLAALFTIPRAVAAPRPTADTVAATPPPPAASRADTLTRICCGTGPAHLLPAGSALARRPRPIPFLRPRYLKPGDTVAIVAPAGRIPPKSDTAKIRQRFEAWGLRVRFGKHCAGRSHPYFSAPDSLRAADLQQALDDPSIRAVIALRGGYGSVRLLPLTDLNALRRTPKWLVGFSDITTLHLAALKLRIETIHGAMPAGFRLDDGCEDPSAESLRRALCGDTIRFDTPPHPLNIPGKAEGRLVGGNLSVLCAAIGTPEALHADEPAILFIEEIGEFAYRIDRMMQSLVRSGSLHNIRAVAVGHLTDIMGERAFGCDDIRKVLHDALKPLGIPVLFGLPAGHEEPNMALFLGRTATISVTEQGGSLAF